MFGHRWQIASVCVSAGLAVLTAIALKRRQALRRKRKIPKMKLYWFDNYKSKRCEWIIAELGVSADIELVEVNPEDPNQETLAQYRKVHPHGTVPALEIVGREPILESGAICMFLADLYDSLVPLNTQDRAAYYNWIVYSVTTLDEMLDILYDQFALTDLEDTDTDLINKTVRKFQVFAQYLNRVLSNQDYICGDRFTVADCVLGYSLWIADSEEMRNGALISEYPAIQTYLGRLSRRSSFQRTFPT